MTGGWRRDLDLDLDAIRDWGAIAVLTLIEDHELRSRKVPDLGKKVRDRHTEWYHLPIADGAIPSPEFETQWTDVGAGLHARLRDGFNVLVHLQGRLGPRRHHSCSPADRIRHGSSNGGGRGSPSSSGTIETSGQERYVVALREVPEAVPDPAATKDRAIGALLGLAVGDAIGTTLEFTTRDSYRPVTDMVGGGPFRLKAGQWTDDTAMALALADSLTANDGLDEADLMGALRSLARAGASIPAPAVASISASPPRIPWAARRSIR